MYDVWGGGEESGESFCQVIVLVSVWLCISVCVPMCGQPCTGELFSRNAGGTADKSGCCREYSLWDASA